MSELHKCLLPDELYYQVEMNVWVRPMDDGTVKVGLTDIAQSMAGTFLHCRPAKVGKAVTIGKSLATVETGKWVGPVKSPIAGTLVERNGRVESDPPLLNRSPYSEGWIVRLQPENLQAGLAGLMRGEEALAGFRAYMEDHSLGDCIHVEGFTG